MESKLTDKQERFIAAYVGEANFNATKAADIAGYSSAKQSGTECLANPSIKRRINEHLDTIRDTGIANRAVRIAKLNTMSEKLEAVMDVRAKAAKERFDQGEDIPEEAETGLAIEVTKQIGTGQNAVVTTEWSFDKGLYDAYLKTHEQVARETGDRDKKVEISGPNGGPLQVESGKAKLLELIDEQES